MVSWGNGTPEDPLGGCTTYIGIVDHMGTHIDAFVHTKGRAGATIDEMPLDMFMGKSVCLDLQTHPGSRRHRSQAISRRPRRNRA